MCRNVGCAFFNLDECAHGVLLLEMRCELFSYEKVSCLGTLCLRSLCSEKVFRRGNLSGVKMNEPEPIPLHIGSDGGHGLVHSSAARPL